MSTLRGTRSRIVLGIFAVLAALMLVAVACGDRVDSGTGPLVLYPGEPNGDDADLNGVFMREGNCLYVEEGGTRFLVAFPERETGWREKGQTVYFGGRPIRIGGWITLHFGGSKLSVGERVDLGGSGLGAGERLWAAPPDPSCDSANIWVAG